MVLSGRVGQRFVTILGLNLLGDAVPAFTVQVLFIEPRHPRAGGDFEIIEPSPVATVVG